MPGDHGYSTPPKRIGRPSATIVDEIQAFTLIENFPIRVGECNRDIYASND
jgi:hypothetical protein